MTEFFHNSSYYGAATILRRYAQLPAHLPVPFGWQHGWTRAVHPHDALGDAPENWMWTAERAEQFRELYPHCQFRAMGAPFVYLHRHLRPIRPKCPTGSIFFPAHSSPNCDTRFDAIQMIDRLKHLPIEFHPIVVSMYFVDRDLGRHIPFVEAGLKVVCNGSSLTDASFYRNFLTHAVSRRFALSNAPTSALLYAQLLGLNSYYLSQATHYDNREANLDIHPLVSQMTKEFELHFAFGHADEELKSEFASHELGVRHVASPRVVARHVARLMTSRTYIQRLAQPPLQVAEHRVRQILGHPKRWLLGGRTEGRFQNAR